MLLFLALPNTSPPMPLQTVYQRARHHVLRDLTSLPSVGLPPTPTAQVCDDHHPPLPKFLFLVFALAHAPGIVLPVFPNATAYTTALAKSI